MEQSVYNLEIFIFLNYFLGRINNMDYKIVEMEIYISNYNNKGKEYFITSFQDKVNEFLKNGYIPTGGICISYFPSGNMIHFAQALIKE